MTPKQTLATIAIITFSTLIAGCGKLGTTATTKPANDSDSVKTPVAKALTALPDTQMPSARAVKWHIDVADSASACAPLGELRDTYRDSPDVCTFRKNLSRDGDFGGRVKGTPTRVRVAWEFKTYYNTEATRLGVWGGGTGWTGQPLYASKTGEVIVGSLCGKVYFIDFETGQASRKPLEVVNTIKGTPSLDVELQNLYVGQGVPNHQPFGCMAWDLTTGKQGFFMGRDPKALRGWNAWDSSPAIVGGFLFWPGENGSLYKFKRERGGKLTLACALRYRVNGAAPGIENSLCVYANYGYFGDNHGNIMAVNLNTMKPVWRYFNHDDMDGSIVCREENGVPCLYAACEVDKQGMSGLCHFVKLNGITGELMWEHTIACNRHRVGAKILDGGVYCTPLPGTGDAKGLILVNVCRNGADGKPGRGTGQLVALSMDDGHEVYATPLKQWAWSSPVSFLNERGECFVLTGDASGTVYLIRGKTGEIIHQLQVGLNFESSPMVTGNAAVVGSRQNGIFKLVVE